MRNAETILGIIRDRGKRGLPLEQVYRQLFNPDLYVRAYGKIAQNQGAMTPGTSDETADAMTMRRINDLIDDLRQERYRWAPARRVYIPKANGKKRPLGVTGWRDKLLQEVLRAILESYYEPQFSDHSHGFRPGRGCHSALTDIKLNGSGMSWFIEGDIAQCFDRLDHQILLGILSDKIHDGRFIRLIANLLNAGYLEAWQYHRTLSGVPQGGIVSPVLANIYLDQLDKFVEKTLLPDYNRGQKRRLNAEYRKLTSQAGYLRKLGQFKEADDLRQQYQSIPAIDPNDPTFRRLRYWRYADDFILGFAGPYAEAEEIKQKLATFLHATLKLELSASKTLITHTRTQKARFLGYEISLIQCNIRLDKRRYRTINAKIELHVPADVVRKKCKPYVRNGKPRERPEWLNESPYTIVTTYQAEYRGLVEYYRRAHNLAALRRLQWAMQTSLLKTLADKLDLTVSQVARKYRTIFVTSEGPRKVLEVIVEREDGKRPLIARWGGISLKRDPHAVLDDQPKPIWNVGTELVQRLLADTCELCGSQENVEVHHIKALKSLRPYDNQGSNKPEWVKVMAARRRKTLIVCRPCHAAIHSGGYPVIPLTKQNTGEPCAVTNCTHGSGEG
jgi:group II intron reverse transcriptase/maturase